MKRLSKKGIIRNEDKYFHELGPVYAHPYVNMNDLSDEELLQAKDYLEGISREFGEYT
ncbi:hypothetical protein [Pseudodesulfovibrio sp.]|uniref:hypothetical protein n=1 Tax=unclassified Pseudodesulfovibrio TaxID=2661612 RepID=UPI003B00FB31